MKPWIGVFVTALTLLATPLAAETPRTIIVMDGSGSMWGQIDGRPKLEIARDTVATVLAGIPAGQALGLMAYGHRRKGDCGDIELMVPPAAGTAPTIAADVNAMKFLGKTPLSEAVRQAAEALRYGEEAATVVLVTDGLETCAADPCALGRELEAGGLNFTAHVIGFGLTAAEGAQVSCLAAETGGKYIQAGDAAGLAEALTATVTTPAAPPETAAAPLPEARLTAPDEAAIGTMVQVGWTGPQEDLDTIEIVAPVDDSYLEYAYVSEGNPVSLQMPGTPGIYELRYKHQDHSIVATRPITVIEGPLALMAPDQAAVGQLVPIGWNGPNAVYDNIQLRLAGDDSYVDYAYVASGNPVVLRMPDTAGNYEFTYKFNDAQVLITRPITVLPAGSTPVLAPASLSGPASAAPGADLYIGWTGPRAAGDRIEIRAPGEAGALASADVEDGTPASLTAPETPGTYELIYHFQSEDVLARAPLTVAADMPAATTPGGPVPVTIEADQGGLELSVQWSAVPATDVANPLPPEAWALNDRVSAPVAASFLPGVYDVRGEAGDQVFTGRITVVAGAENHFVIPYDPAQSPAGPDAPGAGAAQPGDPVALKISGEYVGMRIRWQATPAGGQDSLMLGSGDFAAEAWDTRLDPGRWLIEGQAEGGQGPLYVAVISVAPDGPAAITLPRTVAADRSAFALPDGAEGLARCVAEPACYVTDAAAGLRYHLLPGWASGAGYGMETAAGVAATQPSAEFYTGTPLAVQMALNPRQWAASLGPCEAVSVGLLCAVTGTDPAALALLRSTLGAARAEDAAATTTPTATPSAATASGTGPDLAEVMRSLQGIAITAPEGLDLREFLAPGLAKDTQ
ncbi:vWA domain-containing protein [Phaeovulum sp. W22_SRMD_FR3]|uniref:vWA domain-containing protein n=1 Tax=Phaeovulum sp. W22_SRMD_FR3 TaxID=3240274 RepID=UPI003F9B78B3